MPTIVTYEEWKLLPDAVTTGFIFEHPEWWDFGKSDDGKAVARLKPEISNAKVEAHFQKKAEALISAERQTAATKDGV